VSFLKKYIFALLVVLVGSVMFAGCGSPREDERQTVDADNQLIGTWRWDDDPDWRYIFHADGRGERGDPDYPEYYGPIQTFTWWTAGDDRLRIDRDDPNGSLAAQGYIVEESWSFTITGRTLTLESRQSDLLYYYSRSN
jgi:hypothetical protein